MYDYNRMVINCGYLNSYGDGSETFLNQIEVEIGTYHKIMLCFACESG